LIDLKKERIISPTTLINENEENRDEKLKNNSLTNNILENTTTTTEGISTKKNDESQNC
jgi:hypothetical protein